MYWTGIREGECLALRAEDVLPTKKIRINKTFHKIDGEECAGPPKTENSYRETALPEFVYNELLNYMKCLYDLQPQDRIFHFGKGVLGRAITLASEEANVKKIRAHDLRHSHAALLVHLNYNIVAVAERLGDTVKVAMETYAHLYPQSESIVIEDLNKLRPVPLSDIIHNLEEIEKVS